MSLSYLRNCIWFFCLEYWFSGFSVHQCYLKGLFKHQWLGVLHPYRFWHRLGLHNVYFFYMVSGDVDATVLRTTLWELLICEPHLRILPASSSIRETTRNAFEKWCHVPVEQSSTFYSRLFSDVCLNKFILN